MGRGTLRDMAGSDQRQEQLDRSDRDEGEASGADNAAGVREVLRELGVYLAHGHRGTQPPVCRRGGQPSGRGGAEPVHGTFRARGRLGARQPDVGAIESAA